jgi:hypothetical protein
VPIDQLIAVEWGKLGWHGLWQTIHTLEPSERVAA